MIRNGLEVAGGANQAQLLRWGSQFGVDVPAHDDLAQASLRYWARANIRAVEIGWQALGGRFTLLDFNRLCREPESTVHDLLGFLGLPQDSISATELRSIIDPERAQRSVDPVATGQVSAEDLRALRRFGY